MDTQTADRVDIDRTNYDAAPEPSLPATYQAKRDRQPANAVANIAGAISSVMEEIGIIPKGGTNKFQNYDYARIEDILQKLTPLMGKHGLVLVPSEKSRNLFDNEAVVMATYSFTLIHKSGDVWPFPLEWTGISRARDSKGGFDDKALNKCATAAQKEFLKKLFQIPVGDDADAHDTSAQSYPAKPAQQKPPAGKPAQAAPKPAAPVEPPMNPETGEVSPHAIQIQSHDGKFDWIGFGKSYLAALKSSKNADECDAWAKANFENMTMLRGQQPQIYARLSAAITSQVSWTPPAKDEFAPATQTNEDII